MILADGCARISLVDGNQLCEIGPHLLATLGRMG
jgi:hypothetical protein